MLSNEAFMKEHVAILQERVYAHRVMAEETFNRMAIPMAKGYAGFFSWLNLRDYMKEDSYEGEQELYKYIYEHANVVLAPVRILLLNTEKRGIILMCRVISTTVRSMVGIAGFLPARRRPR